MANPIKIVADVTFDANQIAQAGEATAKPALSRLSDGLKKATKPFTMLITADASPAEQVIQQFASQVDSSITAADSKVQQFGKTLLGIGAGGIGAGALLTAIGSGEQQASQQLDAAVTAAGQSIGDYQDRIDSAQSTEEGFAHTHEQTDQALQTLVQSYGDTGQALDRLQLVTDLAAARHISLSKAADLVARVHGGATRVLKQFNIQVGTNADGTKDLEGALDQLAVKVSGQATNSVDTFTGYLRVLGTELQDQVATFGQEYGPLILGVSTGITALGGAISGVSSITGRSAAAKTAEAAATQAQAAANEAAVPTVAEMIAALDAEAAAADTTALSMDALAAAQSDLIESGGILATNSAATTAGLYAEEGAALGTAAALALIVGAPIAATAALSALSDKLGLTDDGFTSLMDAMKGTDPAFNNFSSNVAGFSGNKVVDDLNSAVKANDDYSKALGDAGVTTGDLAVAMVSGGSALDDFNSKVANGKNVTDADRISILGMAASIDKHAESAANAAVHTGQLDQAALDASVAQHKAKDGSTEWAAVLNDLASKGLISKDAVDQLNQSSTEGPDSAHAKALATWLDTVKKNANDAQAAILKLAPADIRVQRGALTIEDDKRAVAEANQKVAEAQRAVTDAQAKLDLVKAQGGSKYDIQSAQFALTDAQDALATAQEGPKKAALDLQQAYLDQADALAAVADQNQYVTTGVHMTAEETNQFTEGALKLLTAQLNGPTHDAIAQNIWDMEIARQKVDAWSGAAKAAATFTPPSPDIGTGANGELDPRLVPPTPGSPTARRSSGVGGPRAAGGSVGPGEVFPGAELGYEVMLHNGLYQAPPAGGFVLNHSQSVDFLGGTAGGHGSGVVVNGDIHVGSERDLSRLSDELNVAAFLVRAPDRLRADAAMAGV